MDLPTVAFRYPACVYDQFRVSGEAVDKGDVKIGSGRIVFGSSELKRMNFDLEI